MIIITIIIIVMTKSVHTIEVFCPSSVEPFFISYINATCSN